MTDPIVYTLQGGPFHGMQMTWLTGLLGHVIRIPHLTPSGPREYVYERAADGQFRYVRTDA